MTTHDDDVAVVRNVLALAFLDADPRVTPALAARPDAYLPQLLLTAVQAVVYSAGIH